MHKLGTHLVPTTLSDICFLPAPLNSKTLFLRTNSAISKSFLWEYFALASRAFLRTLNPATLAIQRYNPITSAGTKMFQNVFDPIYFNYKVS